MTPNPPQYGGSDTLVGGPMYRGELRVGEIAEVLEADL